MSKKLSTETYKGVRDFYPEDMAVQNQIFKIWKDVSEKYGYQEYNASVLEPADLYKAKSGEEIIERQTYTFTDRGDREVTLRPEMTPTVARMVAGKKRELVFPLRWYSIPNFFRYEQPQRGRLREFWQLNVDIFGVEGLEAEIECIQMAYDITRAYGLKDSDFEIRINSRKILNHITQVVLGLDAETSQKMLKLIDKKNKIPADVFTATAEKILGDIPDGEKITLFTALFSENGVDEKFEGMNEVAEVMESLAKLGIKNTVFDQSLTRGADYYTGVIFEIFDKNPNNKRSVFGGGRYDELLDLFSSEKVSAVGFGAGDVVAKDLMETYGTLVKGVAPADIALVVLNKESMGFAQEVAQKIRSKGQKVLINYSNKKISDQIKNADKMHVPSVIVIGEEEVKSGKLKIKNLESGEEKPFSLYLMRKITFDIETKNTFQEVGSTESSALDISVVCIHDSETDEYTSYLQEDFPKLWPILEKADMFITFNGDHFDIPLLNKYYSGDLTKIKSLDLLVEVRNSLGRRIKMDTLAEATLGKKKIGHGLDAIVWWQNGEIDKIIKYCIEDVKITKELYDYARANGMLKYKDLGVGGAVKEIKLDTSKWEEKDDSSMTLTMPF